MKTWKKSGCDDDDDEPLPRPAPPLTKKRVAAISNAPAATPWYPAVSNSFKPTIVPPSKPISRPLPVLTAESTPTAQISSPRAQKSGKKRAHSKVSKIEDELQDLQMDETRYPTNPPKRHRPSYASDMTDEVDAEEDADPDATGDFHFIAITDYHPNGDPKGYKSQTDLQGVCDELWERIEIVQRTIWEKNAGEDWRWELDKMGWSVDKPLCVSQKLQKGARVKWRSGCEGKYACRDCVMTGRPCFTWIEQEFRLLPLHGKDRVKGVVAGESEIRYWVNDGTELVDTDVVGEEDDYVV